MRRLNEGIALQMRLTRFNEAAIFQSRKLIVCEWLIALSSCFNEAAIFQSRKFADRLKIFIKNVTLSIAMRDNYRYLYVCG